MMIRHSLRAAIAAAVFVVEASAQSTARPSEPRDRTQRSQQDPRTPSQPGGETKATDKQTSAIERVRAFLEKHPDVRAKLFAKADANGDGKLSPDEREQMKRLVMSAVGEVKENVRERQDERQDGRQDRREDRQDDRQDARDDRQDGRQDRRDDRQDGRQDARDEHQDGRQDGRDGRQDDRQDGRDERRGNAGDRGVNGPTGIKESGASNDGWDIDDSGRITPREKKAAAENGTEEPGTERSRGQRSQRGGQSDEGNSQRPAVRERTGETTRAGRDRSTDGQSQRGSRERADAGKSRDGNRSRTERK